VLAIAQLVAKTVGTDDGAGMQNDVIPRVAHRVEHYVRVEYSSLFAQRDTVGQYDSRPSPSSYCREWCAHRWTRTPPHTCLAKVAAGSIWALALGVPALRFCG